MGESQERGKGSRDEADLRGQKRKKKLTADERGE